MSLRAIGGEHRRSIGEQDLAHLFPMRIFKHPQADLLGYVCCIEMIMLRRTPMLHRFRTLIVVAFAAGTVTTAQTIRAVDCDRESLQQAVSSSNRGDTLRIAGTCREPVTVNVDRLTLDGQDTAVFDRGVPGGGPFELHGGAFNATIVIDGARGVTVRGFLVRNSPGGGLIGRSNAAFKMQNTTLQNNYFGMVVQDASQAEIENSEITGNTDGGIGITNTSTVVFKKSVKANNNLEGIYAS
jgi:nitrous oxidase accessory protein NosD